VTITPVARQRRHTLHFLAEIRLIAPVFLDTEIDMRQVLDHRGAERGAARKYSIATYVLHAAAKTLAAHPEANAAIRGRIRPKIARYRSVNGKLAMDKTIGGQRVVLSAVLPDLDRASLAEIQDLVDHYRDGDPEQMAEFAGVRLLHRLPWPLRGAAYRSVVRPLAKRSAAVGTFAVTSLGHRPVDSFHSVGGTTITLGVGRILDRPIAEDGAVVVAPMMRLSLCFDHRVIDGAEAADVLGDLKNELENFKTPTS
jgi:pyruvate/2-oxoglutarate dehydrogenase complex dihydrolipoamide acyltransferase (E2) component